MMGPWRNNSLVPSTSRGVAPKIGTEAQAKTQAEAPVGGTGSDASLVVLPVEDGLT